MNMSLPSQPSDADDFPLAKDNIKSATPVSSSPSTPVGGLGKKMNHSSGMSSIIAMEEDSMSTSASISPVPIESDSKQSMDAQLIRFFSQLFEISLNFFF